MAPTTQPRGTFKVGRKHIKKFEVVEVGDTFSMMGWHWTVVEVAPTGRTMTAETPIPDRAAPMRREFSTEVGEMYFGEPDPEPNEDDE